MTDDEVLVEIKNGVAVVTLNRPQQINALTMNMIDQLTRYFTQWLDDDQVRSIELRGAGDRGFCSGADIVQLHNEIVVGNPGALHEFLSREYALDAMIANYPKPITAYLVGVSMGGGLGLGMHNTHRVGALNTKMAMPETMIGLWPDVGVCYELARTPGQVGAYLAMTGYAVDGLSARWAGLLDELPGASAEDVAGCQLAADWQWINACFAGHDPVEILARLRGCGVEKANQVADDIETRSPLSVWIALSLVRRAAEAKTVDDVLDLDRKLGAITAADPDDFVAGVYGKMIAKTAPKWRHSRLADVTPGEVAARFRGSAKYC